MWKMLRRVEVPCPCCGDKHMHEEDIGVEGEYAELQRYWMDRTKNGEYPDGSHLYTARSDRKLQQVDYLEVWFKDYEDIGDE